MPRAAHVPSILRRFASPLFARPAGFPSLMVAMALALAAPGVVARAALSLRLEDYATAPITGSTIFPATTANSAYLARLNFLSEEPGGGSRFFVNDLNGKLYIVDKATKQFTPYLDFNGRGGRPGMFDEFAFTSGFANGLITFQFDPDYANNGKFYTVHMEDPNAIQGETHGPNPASLPGLNTTGYTVTGSINAPGSAARHTVLIEWKDDVPSNAVFEGTAREVMRMDMVGQIHPMGDLIFNPTAGPGNPDWRVMYISVGDGGAGEQQTEDVRMTPQRLDSLGGKILRIIPDLAMNTATSTVSINGRYRIPTSNPYTTINNSAVRDELYAVGLRNPHRMSWDVDPTNPNLNHLIVNDIGLHTWEEVNIIQAGRNYGYSEREGNEQLDSDNQTSSLPASDLIPVQVTGSTTAGTIAPTYPVIQYGHGLAGQDGFAGDSITSGYVYRGSLIPQLYGKYIFGDITTGQLLYADYAEMLAADDGDPSTLAEVHAISLLWDNPVDPRENLETPYRTIHPQGAVLGPLFQIVETMYELRGGEDANLPGAADVTAPYGRADFRLQVDNAGELYVLSKSDGMIRALVSVGADGDVDEDYDVDGADLARWASGFGVATAAHAKDGDADADGAVDGRDFLVWQRQFGQGAAAAVVSVPEPRASTLTLICAVAGAAYRRRRE